MAEYHPQRMTLEDYSSSTTPQYFTNIARPDVQAANIIYPHFFIQLIQGNLFHGLLSEEPYTHLATYIKICNMSKALDCFHWLLWKTPTHGFSELVQLNIFIDGLRPHSIQLLDASSGGKIKLKTLEEAMELIENMVVSDHVILNDRAYTPTKKSLLELTSQDAMLAQNKLLAKTLETLTTTLSNLPQQLHVVQPSLSLVMHIGGCNICGGAHESGSCMI
ncbi:hypothetical protein GmHk_07G019239 [Glycine max]|nr:hypothetical protein GmHk_07G019239 [Glycine max]